MSDDQATPEVTDLGEIPATEVKSGVATLSVRYVEGVPTLVVSGGPVPDALTVVDGSGLPVALYTAGPVAKVGARYSHTDHLGSVSEEPDS